MIIKVRVTASAKINKITTDDGGNLKVYTTTAAEDGNANIAVIRQLAVHLGMPKSHIKLIRGATRRDKVLVIKD